MPASQSEQYDEPSTEVVLLAQAVHAVMPEPMAKRPASHGVHWSTDTSRVAEELVPGGHALHLASASTPAAPEKVPPLQGSQPSSLEAPIVLLQVPSGHGSQLTAADDELNRPAPHVPHADSSTPEE